MLKTNSKEYMSNIESYIFDCIENEDQELLTIQEKLTYLFSEFKRVADYPANLHNIPNNTERLADYLQGLPFSFEFSNYNILLIAAKLHNIDVIPENKEDIIINGYWLHLATKLFQLKNKYNV